MKTATNRLQATAEIPGEDSLGEASMPPDDRAADINLSFRRRSIEEPVGTRVFEESDLRDLRRKSMW